MLEAVSLERDPNLLVQAEIAGLRPQNPSCSWSQVGPRSLHFQKAPN